MLVTQGANQGIAVAMQAFVEPGDEVLLIEPYFDIYKPCVEVYPAAGCRPSHLRCGGSVTTAPLRLGRPLLAKISANDWQVDFAELEGKITSRTKGILINNPHNPTGKMFSLDEMQQIALLALKHNLLVFSDDVVRLGWPFSLLTDGLCSTIASTTLSLRCASPASRACGTARSPLPLAGRRLA